MLWKVSGKHLILLAVLAEDSSPELSHFIVAPMTNESGPPRRVCVLIVAFVARDSIVLDSRTHIHLSKSTETLCVDTLGK